jgi:hypothetical protein
MGQTTNSDPLVLTAADARQVKTKPAAKQQDQDPLVLGPQDASLVKKKVGGGASGSATSPTPSDAQSPVDAARAFDERKATPSDINTLAQTDAGKKMGLNNLSPDAKEVFAQAHNGKKKSDLVNGVSGLIDNYYPQTQDPKLNQKRFEIKQSVLSGNQDAIAGLKSNIVQNLQQKIDKRSDEVRASLVGMGPGAWKFGSQMIDNDPQVIQLRAQQKKASDDIDEFGKQAIVSSKDMEAWLQLDANHPNIQTSIAAEKLGKMSEDRYGAERLTPNKEHDRMATGFRLIMENLQMDINDLLSKGIPAKNPELLKQAQDKIATLSRYRDMYDKLDVEQFPDVGLDKTARFLGDIIAEKHPNKLIRTGADVKEAGEIAEQRNPGFMKKYGQFVQTAAQKQDQGTFIPRGGGVVNELIGGVMTDAAKNALDLLKWKARVVGDEGLSDVDKLDISRGDSPGMRGTTQSRTEPTKITYDQEGKAYREMPNENYSTLPWNNFFRFAGSSLPGLAEFIASEGVGKTATYALTLGRAGKATTEFGGLLAATYLTSYNSNREFADANIDDKSNLGEAKKVIMANFLTVANAGVFHALNASPSKMVEKAISKAVAPDVMKVFEENSWEQLSEKTASSFLKDKILPRAKAIVEKFAEAGKGGLKMGTAAVIDQKMHDLAGAITNSNYTPSTIEDNARNFVQQALLMTMVGGVAGMVTTGDVPHATKEALHQAGLYAPQYIDQINERVQNGQLDPQKANGMIAMVKTMGEELQKAAKETTKDGTPLTVLQQRDLAIANFRKRAAATLDENGQNVPREKIESDADQQVKEIKAQNNWQLIEDTPTFKSVKEVDESGNIGGNVSSMDDIDPAKQYSYEKDGEWVQTDGAELIHHLETGDIHEKEVDNTQETDAEKAKDAEGKTAQPSPDEEKDDVGAYKPTIRDDYFAKSDFFTPEEKEKFATLDDAGKDKMIDEKRAELKAKKDGPAAVSAKVKAENPHLSGFELKQKEADALKKYAEENGLMLPERTEEPHGKGNEQTVYVNEDGKTVTKVNPNKVNESWGALFDRIDLHNSLFPDTAYTFKGFSEDADGNLSAVYEQPLIVKSDDPVKYSEVKAELGKLGFEPSTSKDFDHLDAGVYFDNKKTGVRIADLTDGNVIKGVDGDIHFVDPFITQRKIAENETGKISEPGSQGDEREEDGGSKKDAKTDQGSVHSPDKGTGGENKGKSDEERLKERDALQGSYDRLIASGVDPEDSDMRSLKRKIDNLSSPKTETDGNVKTEQSSSSKEADGQESGQEGQQKDDEKGDVTPEPDKGAEEEEKAAPTSPESKSPIIGIRDSIVNADRVHRGLEPLLKEFTRHWQHNWNQIKANIRKGFSPRKFIEETAQRIAREDNDKSKGVRSKHRTTFSDYDYATLLFDRLDISNNIAHAQDALEEAKSKDDLGAETAAQQILDRYNEQLIQNDTVGRRMKSESGRSLSAIQMMTKMDGELVNWNRDMENLYHGTMPAVLKGFVERIEKEYKAKTEELRVHQEEQLKKAAEDAFKKGKEEGLKERKTSKPDKNVKVKGKELADKVRALRDKLGTNRRDALQSNLFGLPIAVVDGLLVTVANIVEATGDLAHAINEALKDIEFKSDKDKNAFIASLQNEEDPNSEQAKRAGYLQDIESIAKENDATTLVPDAVKSVRKLMTSYVKDDSVKSLDELVKKTHEDLKDALPDVTEKDLRDAFSGYGAKSDTEGRVKSDLAKMKEQARKVSEYQELLKPKPGESLSQETKRLEKAAKLHDEVNGYMREMGIEETPPPTTTEGKKAVALDKSKSRMRSIIKDLNKQILAGERKQRNGITPDGELTVLKAERDRLNTQLNEISKARVSPEQKIKRIEDALNRQILNYERQIREGVDPLRPREERPTTKQIEQLRQQKNKLKKEVEGLHRDVDPKVDQQQRALADYNEGLEKKINELEAKLESGDLEKESPPVKIDFSRDKRSLELESRLKRLEGDFQAARKAGELINRTWLQKAMSLAAATKRAFVLSRISTYGRLFAADVWSNAVFAPAETVAGSLGYIGTKLGFAKKLSEQADRYGAPLSIKDFATIGKAEAAAVKALGNPQTWKDFVTDVKSGYNELSLMYGDTHTNVPKELRDHWQSIEHGLEVIGRTHGAVKGISKRMEFARSYVIRKESARRKGADVDNPVVQASIGTMAYQDAARHVLMEDNLASKGYEKVIRWLEDKGGVGGQFAALTMKELMPIVKIPTNMILNAARATLGTPLAGGAIVARGIAEVMSNGKSEWGISKLTPEQSEAILRNFRKGNVGVGLMLAGFFAPNMFGAAHYYQKGVDQPEGMEEGDVKFFGVKVPKWLADNPYLVTMKVGASLRSAFNYYTDEKDEGMLKAAATALANTAASAAEETPLIGSPTQIYQAARGYGADYFIYNFVKSSLEPGLLQEIAEDTDNRGDNWSDIFMGDRIKRKPQNIGESLKTGIPGLREQVEQK